MYKSITYIACTCLFQKRVLLTDLSDLTSSSSNTNIVKNKILRPVGRKKDVVKKIVGLHFLSL